MGEKPQKERFKITTSVSTVYSVLVGCLWDILLIFPLYNHLFGWMWRNFRTIELEVDLVSYPMGLIVPKVPSLQLIKRHFSYSPGTRTFPLWSCRLWTCFCFKLIVSVFLPRRLRTKGSISKTAMKSHSQCLGNGCALLCFLGIQERTAFQFLACVYQNIEEGVHNLEGTKNSWFSKCSYWGRLKHALAL